MERLKKIMALILSVLFLLGTNNVFAARLNVINGDETAKIYINDNYISNKSVTDYEIEPGFHQIQVIKYNEIIFSKIIEVKPTIVNTIETNSFIDAKSIIVNRGAERKEVNRIKDSKGNIGIGVHVANVTSGFSFKLMGDKFGLQLTGWLDKTKTREYSAFGSRLIYNISDRLSSSRLISLYTAIGYGTNTDSLFGYNKQLWEGVLGIEINAASLGNIGLLGLTVPGIFASLLKNIENSYFSLELGIESVSENKELDHVGFKFGTGIHFYF